jgi:inosine-uridine nucleoside N-ribohydrolase
MSPLILTCGLLLNVPAPATAKPVPVILDTDIGDDIDDTWALTLLLKLPQFDLKLVTTTYGKAEYRAKIIAKLLTAAGRDDVPIGLGVGGHGGDGGQSEWVKDENLESYRGKIYYNGAQALVDTVNASPETVRIIDIGPPVTLAAALGKDPSIASKSIFVGMQGAVRKGYGGGPVGTEWNVKADVKASKVIFAAPWKQALITPLDTCGLVTLGGARFQALVDSPDAMTQAMLENYRIWSHKPKLSDIHASSTLFDTCAIYLALPEDKPLMTIEKLSLIVTDDGLTAIDAAGRPFEVATAWTSLDGYCDWIVKTLGGPVVTRSM